MKAKILATSRPGSSAGNYMRYLVAKAGLDPKTDVTIISLGSGAVKFPERF